MINKSNLEAVISRQRKQAGELPAGFNRQISSGMPYLTDKALLIGGVRGTGCSTLLRQMLGGEYSGGWYTNFEDPRLGGFDENDFLKLAHLIADSGRGVVLLDRPDTAPGWRDFIRAMLAKEIKVVAAVSSGTLDRVEEENPGEFEIRRPGLLSYTEFLDANRRQPSNASVAEYIQKGAFPSQSKPGAKEDALRDIYDDIMLRDVIVAGGVRDHAAVQRIALRLMDLCTEGVSANSLRTELKIKAVSTVNEHFDLLSRAGLFSFVPIFSDRPAQQAVNPRKVYPVDTALASAVSTQGTPGEGRLFETAVFRYLKYKYGDVFYTSDEGGCDFVVSDESGVKCIQSCFDPEDIDMLLAKSEGLVRAMESTGASRGIMVVSHQAEEPTSEGFEVVDADMFLSGEAGV